MVLLLALWEKGPQVGKGPCLDLGGTLGSHCLPTGGLWRLEAPGHNCTDPGPLCTPTALPALLSTPNFFSDLLHPTSTHHLTSGQNPCIWFSVTIILVMMTKTEVPLGGEGRETRAPCQFPRWALRPPPPCRGGNPGSGSDFARVTGLTKGRGGSRPGSSGHPLAPWAPSVCCAWLQDLRQTSRGALLP